MPTCTTLGTALGLDEVLLVQTGWARDVANVHLTIEIGFGFTVLVVSIHLLPILSEELGLASLGDPHPNRNIELNAAGRETRMETTCNGLAQMLQPLTKSLVR